MSLASKQKMSYSGSYQICCWNSLSKEWQVDRKWFKENDCTECFPDSVSRVSTNAWRL